MMSGKKKPMTHEHTVTDDFVLFWHGPFSQWYPCEFTLGGAKYNCTEQYMMAKKALFFEDEQSWLKIMACDSPKVQKAIGRTVTNFDVEKWKDVCEEIVYVGNYAKFTQDDYLKSVILGTENRTLVEASPYDKIWGIGLAETDPKALNPDSWQGLNLLGIALMKVRESIVLYLGDEK